MASMMTRAEAERILGLTEDYAFADLKTRYKRHLVQFHPDRFPDEPSDGQMGKAEAEREFVKGTQAFDTLSPLFAGMPCDHRETPEANWGAHADTAGRGPGHDATDHPRASETTNAYANGYAEAGGAGDGPNDPFGQATAWERGYANRTRDTTGTTGDGATGGWTTNTNPGDGRNPSSTRRSDTARQRQATSAGTKATHAAYATRQSQAPKARSGVVGSPPSNTTGYATAHGGPLFWCLLVVGVLAIVFWNRSDPKTAFVSVVQFLLDPGKLLFLLTVLGFVYLKGW